MNEKQFGRQLVMLRKTFGLTQDDLAARLHVSAQAVSKWENGHSLPETALLPALARTLDVSIDELFQPGSLLIVEALYGDGMESVNVTKRLNRLVENDGLEVVVSTPLLGAGVSGERVSFLTIKYRALAGICYAVFLEGERVCLSSGDASAVAPGEGLSIIAGRYGTKAHHYDVMHKMEHYQPFGWDAYHANHETFPSDPANDTTEYLTLVYRNGGGIHMATCAEGESLALEGDELVRRVKGGACFIAGVPSMPPFGEGMECSWAAALTVALQAMHVQTDYTEVMGVSGACYRLAFCSPGWDYSSVDGLVAYDYATPGFAAFGYTPVLYSRIEKEDRAAHRARIAKEIRNNMPVLGINLRVAPEWGVIGGYEKDGEVLFCRTKYDKPTIENDPAFMRGRPAFQRAWLGQHGCLQVDNWPFLLCYFDRKREPPTRRENLVASLKTFVDCAGKGRDGNYSLGFAAYAVWASDLRDDDFYEACSDAQLMRRFSVNRFCVLSLLDARRAAYGYLVRACGKAGDGDALLRQIAGCFEKSAGIAAAMQRMVEGDMEEDGARIRAFWTAEKRHGQAEALEEMAVLEGEACRQAAAFVAG